MCLPSAWVIPWVVDWREMVWDLTEVGHPMGFGLEGDGAGPCWARSYRAAWGPVVWHLLLAMPRSTLPKGVTAFGAASLGLQVLVPLDGSPKVGQAFGFGQAGAAASRAEGPQGSTRGRPAPLGLLTGCRHLGDAG